MARRTARNTQRRKAKFLAAYERLGNATAVAEETGISRYTHKEWLKKSETYRQAFQEADDAATEVLEKEAIRRAVEGNEEPVYYNGQKVGTVRKYSDVLLIFLLKSKRPEVYRERYDARLTANLNVQSAVKVVHEYHDSPPTIDVTAAQEPQPNVKLLSSTHPPPMGTDGTGTTLSYAVPAQPEDELPSDTTALDLPNPENPNE